MSDERLRVAVFGYGVVGPLHCLAYRLLPTLFPGPSRGVQLALVVDPDEERRDRARRELDLSVTTPETDVLDRHEIDVVDCCVPTRHHGDVCGLAITSGRHVLCEKPLTGDAERSRRLLALTTAARGRFGMNFNFRFVPALQEARTRITSGDLGNLRSFRVEYHRSSNIHRWESGDLADRSAESGALLDLGPHAIDVVHFLFGPIARLSAYARQYSGEPVTDGRDDIARLDVFLLDQATGTIEVSKVTPGAANNLEVFAFGTAGTLRFSMDRPDHLQLFTQRQKSPVHEQQRVLSAGIPKMSAIPAETPTGVLQWHAASIATFVEAVRTGEPVTPSVRDGLGVDVVLTAARASLVRESEWQDIENW